MPALTKIEKKKQQEAAKVAKLMKKHEDEMKK